MNPNDPNQQPVQQPNPNTPPPPPQPAPGAPQQPMQPQPPQVPHPPVQHPMPQPPMQVQPAAPGGGSKTKLIAIIGGAVALIIVVIVLILVLGGGDDSANTANDGNAESSEASDTDSSSEESAAPIGETLKTGGDPIESSFESDVVCEAGTVPANLTASSGNTYRVETFQQDDRFPENYSSVYLRLEDRNETDFDAELEIDGVACLQRQSEVSETIKCDFEVDEEGVEVTVKRSNFDMQVYDMQTGELVGEAVVGSEAECPTFALIDENNELFAEPNADDGGAKIAELTKDR